MVKMLDWHVLQETNMLLSATEQKIKVDVDITKRDLVRKGYDVFVILPGQVTLTEVYGKLGFYLLIPDNVAKNLVKLMKNYQFDKIDVLFGFESNLMVFLITLQDQENKMAILYPIYYHRSKECITREKGPKGIYTYFRILSGSIMCSVNMTDYRLFLGSEAMKMMESPNI